MKHVMIYYMYMMTVVIKKYRWKDSRKKLREKKSMTKKHESLHIDLNQPNVYMVHNALNKNM